MIAGLIFAFIIFVMEIQIMDLQQDCKDLRNKFKGDKK